MTGQVNPPIHCESKALVTTDMTPNPHNTARMRAVFRLNRPTSQLIVIMMAPKTAEKASKNCHVPASSMSPV